MTMIDGIDYMQDSLMWVMHLRSYRCLPEKCKLRDTAEPLCVVRFGRVPYLVHQCDRDGQAYISYDDYLFQHTMGELPWESHICGCDWPLFFYERDDWGDPDHRCSPDDKMSYFIFNDWSILSHDEAMVRLGHPERQVNPARQDP
jgi:hypothetical protein